MMKTDEPVSQTALEARMREVSAAGGGTVDMEGARVLITEPPLTVPSGINLIGCLFELHLPAPGPGEGWSASYSLPDIITGSADSSCSGHVSLDAEGRLTVEVGEGGEIRGCGFVQLPDGSLLAEILPT